VNQIAFVQGRLVNKVDNKIQAFPRDDWEKELEIANENNINFIELTVDLNRIWENPVASSLGITKLKNKLSSCDIKPLACTADFIMHNPPWKSDTEDITLITKKIIEGLGKIGCKFIVIPFVDDSSIQKDDEDAAFKFLMSLESCLEKNRVEVAIESDFKPKNLFKLIKRMPSDLYGINYDIGNSASLGYDINEEFSLYFNRIKHIHIKDRLLRGTTVPLGEGNADLTLCFNLLRNYNYKGNFSMQTARDESGNHVEVMLKYIDMVKKNINANY
jgi:hexulose-6-phosphate isomerase